MRITCVFSLFSGLETSLLSGRWQPTGVPTVYKLIEALDKSEHELSVLFTCKSNMTACKRSEDRTVEIKGLTVRPKVIAGSQAIPRRYGRFRGPLRELRQFLGIYRHYRSVRPDLLYFDRANLWSAALFARYSNTPVIFRVMGVKRDMFDAITPRNPVEFAMRHCYRSPFALVLCTQDGSGIEHWSQKALRESVPKRMWLNGVEPARVDVLSEDKVLRSLPKGQTIVLFLGTLEEIKGCKEFMEGFLRAWRMDKKGLHALVIGTGRLKDSLIEMVHMQNADHAVSFIDRLPHSQIGKAISKCHIYVSLNRLGNLSNANLEVMKSGCCAMIVPKAQPEYGIDVATEQLIPESAVMRIAWNRQVASSLAETILMLHNKPKLRINLANSIKSVANNLFITWNQRIKNEIDLIESIHANFFKPCK